MLFNVSGMTCGHCAQAISKAIRAVDPRASVEVNVENGSVAVDSSASPERIAAAIPEEGYEVAPL